MPPAITITGETGQGWDATARSPDALGLSSLVLTGASLEQDSLRATRKVKDFDLSGWPVPSVNQQVTVARDGTPIWKGWITKVRSRVGDGIRPRLEIEASGVWWHLRKTPLAATQQHQGFQTSGDRPQFAVAKDTTIGAAITGLLTAYNARFPDPDPRRVTIGAMADTFPIPHTVLSGGDFLSALAELLRFCPDAMAWWDTPASGHNAIFRLSRRATAAVQTLAMGTDHISSADFEPKPDLQLTEGVRVDFAEVVNDQSANTGKPKYMAQISGGATGAAQRLMLSGPEADTFLPATSTASAVISSQSLSATFIITRDPSLKDVGTDVLNSNRRSEVDVFNIQAINPKTGAAVGGYALSSNVSPADWWAKLPSPIYWTAVEFAAYLTMFSSAPFTRNDPGAGVYELNTAYSSGSYPYGYYKTFQSYITGLPNWSYTPLTASEHAFLKAATIHTREENIDIAGYPEFWNTRYWATYNSKFSGVMINLLLTNATRYRPPDYTFHAPPANLAQNLADAQNFLPWEGAVEFPNPNIGNRSFAGRILRVGGGPTDWASMNAMVQSHTMDFFSLRESVNCGIPPRLSSLNLTQKVRPNGQANITYL